MADEEQYEVDGQLPLMEDPFEAAEVQRLADALEVMDAGGRPDIDPREDPELASFVRAAGMLLMPLALAAGAWVVAVMARSGKQGTTMKPSDEAERLAARLTSSRSN